MEVSGTPAAEESRECVAAGARTIGVRLHVRPAMRSLMTLKVERRDDAERGQVEDRHVAD
jgi:hypothetical protein